MKKPSILLLIATACVVILIIQKFTTLPQTEQKQDDEVRSILEPKDEIDSNDELIDPKALQEAKDRETFETTYRYLRSDASSGDPDAPANSVFLGHRFIQEKSYLKNDPDTLPELSEELKVLYQEDGSEQQVVNALHSLLHSLRIAGNKGYFDAGSNVEITNALLGYNARKIAFISAKSPRINESGKLLDQWGTPYLFHMISRQKVTVQSAGADLILFTEDDIYPSSD